MSVVLGLVDCLTGVGECCGGAISADWGIVGWVTGVGKCCYGAISASLTCVADVLS